MRWPIKIRDHDLQGHVDGQAKTFTRLRRTRNANLEWRGYEATEAITLLEKLQSGGDEAIVKIFGRLEKDMRVGLIRQLGKEWYKNGDLAANAAANTWHGIESLMQGPGAQTASDELATSLTKTYAGQSTSYTAFKSTAVKGTDEEYGVWSPVIVNTAQNPGSGVRAFGDYADEYIRVLVNEACYGHSAEDMLDIIILTKSAYRDLLNIADDKERLVFDRGESLDLVKMGFKKTVELDGTAITWDFGLPGTDDDSNVVQGYGFNCDKLELKLGGSEKQIWKNNSTFNSDHQANRFYFYSLGNLVFESPKFFGKLAAI